MTPQNVSGTEARLRNLGAALHETSQGNPRLVLDWRFYADGHVSVAALDADGHQLAPEASLQCDSPEGAVRGAADITLFAIREATRRRPKKTGQGARKAKR
jgi:hypothetical protein